MLKFLKQILQLIISPKNGWEDISHSGEEPSKLMTGGFYPLIGFASISSFLTLIYSTETSFTPVLQTAVITFVKYFASYFLAINLIPLFLFRFINGEVNDKKIATFAIYNISMLALFTIIQNIVSVELAITIFLPLIVPIVMWGGARYMSVNPEKVSAYMVVAILTTLIPPLLIGYIFQMLIPAA